MAQSLSGHLEEENHTHDCDDVAEKVTSTTAYLKSAYARSKITLLVTLHVRSAHSTSIDVRFCSIAKLHLDLATHTPGN